MIKFGYLLLLVISLLSLLSIDYRLRLAVFIRPRQTLKILLITVVGFLLWDIAGLWLHIFATNQAYVSGIYVATPNLPVEEALLLSLIAYLTLLLYTWLEGRS